VYHQSSMVYLLIKRWSEKAFKSLPQGFNILKPGHRTKMPTGQDRSPLEFVRLSILKNSSWHHFGSLGPVGCQGSWHETWENPTSQTFKTEKCSFTFPPINLIYFSLPVILDKF
jgi:hypothetical protein